jgi:hypothetical protein
MILSHPLSRFRPLFEMPADFGRGSVTAAPALDSDFDYAGFSPGVAAEARFVAERIRARLRGCIIDIGAELCRMKALLPHGSFRPWCEAALGLDTRTAQLYMAVYRRLGSKSETVSHLNATTLMRLAAKSVPQDVVDAITARFADNQPMTDAEVLRAISDAKAPSQPEPDGRPTPDAGTTADAKPFITADERAAVLAKFAKARAIRDGTDNAGTRNAAAGRMKVLAGKIGMTIEQAIAALDAPKRPAPMSSDPNDWLRDLMNTPEHRAWANEQAQKRAARRAAALAEYGSEDAVWEPCERERALDDACRHFIVRRPVINGEIDTLRGWDGGGWDQLAAEAQKAVANAYAVPETVRAIWDEFLYWEKRLDDQCAFEPDVSHPVCVQARVAFLEDRLDTLPARSVGDLKARVSWLQFEVERGFVGNQETERQRLATLHDDVVSMGDRMRGQADRIRELAAELASREPSKPASEPELSDAPF